MKRILARLHVALLGGLLAAFPLRAVTVCDEASLRAALVYGGQITFTCDTTILLQHALVVSNTVTLDASGHGVTLSGTGKTRVFQIEAGGSLLLLGLTIRDGLAQGTDGGIGQDGGSAEGGAISVASTGTLTASDCRLLNNMAVGGKGGEGGRGGSALGGAVSSQGGALVLTNCLFSGNRSGSQGGAIAMTNGAFQANHCAFTNNTSLTGGALALGSASGSVSNCLFVGNSAGGGGGAIHHLASLTVSASRFVRNSTSGRPVAQGGAIFSSGDLNIAQSQFMENHAHGDSGYVMGSSAYAAGHGEGGALSLLSGVANITDSTFDGNTAAGGVGCCLFPSAAPGNARGGAVYTQNQTTIQNVTFVHNAARGGSFFPGSWPRLAGMGGAVASGGGELRILYSTIATNEAFGPTNNPPSIVVPPSARGGGVFLSGSNSYLVGCILSGNTTNDVPGDNIHPSLIDGGSNLSSDNTGGGGVDTYLNVDPKLSSLADNGGPVQTMALLAGSQAIDTAESVGSIHCPATDARGMPRGQSNGRCDIGAFEQTFLTIQKVARSEVELGYFGVPDETYALEASTDLVTWQALSTQPGGITFRAASDAVPGQFFRVKLQPR